MPSAASLLNRARQRSRRDLEKYAVALHPAAFAPSWQLRARLGFGLTVGSTSGYEVVGSSGVEIPVGLAAQPMELRGAYMTHVSDDIPADDTDSFAFYVVARRKQQGSFKDRTLTSKGLSRQGVTATLGLNMMQTPTIPEVRRVLAGESVWVLVRKAGTPADVAPGLEFVLDFAGHPQ